MTLQTLPPSILVSCHFGPDCVSGPSLTTAARPRSLSQGGMKILLKYAGKDATEA